MFRAVSSPHGQYRRAAAHHLFVFAADAGHDYGSIETKGYHKIVVEKDGKPAIVDNPKWV